MCFFLYLFPRQSTLPQLGQAEVQTEMQTLLPGQTVLIYLLLLSYSDLMKSRGEKKRGHLKDHDLL